MITVIKRWFWLLVWSLTAIYASLILINSLLFPGVRREQVLPINTTLLIGLVGLLFILLLLNHRLMVKHSKYRIFFYSVTLLLLLIMQIGSSISMQGALGVDDFDVRLQIANFLAGNDQWSPYFAFGPNAGVVIFFSKLLKYGFGNPQETSLIFNLINFLFIDVAFFSGWKSLKVFGKHNEADLYYVLGVLFSPLWMAALIVYTDVPALGFGMLGVLLYLYSQKVNRSCLSYGALIGSALMIILSVYMKENMLILLITVFLSECLSHKAFNWRRGIILLLAFAVFGVGIKLINHHEQIPESEYPTSYWVAIGYNTATDATVAKGKNQTWPATGALPNKEARQKYDQALIKDEIKTAGPIGLVKLFLKKINVQWSLGTFGAESRSYNLLSKPSRLYPLIFGSRRDIIRIWSQLMYVLIIVGVLITSIVVLKSTTQNSTSLLNLIALYFVGIFSFHTFIWEVQERYAYVTVIALLALAGCGLTVLFKYTTRKVSVIETRHYVGGISLIALLILLGGALNLRHLTWSTNTSQVVMGQDFFRRENLVIKPHTTFKETLIVKKNFNRWQSSSQWSNNKQLLIKINDQIMRSGNLTGDFKAGRYMLSVTNRSAKPQALDLEKGGWQDLYQQSVKGHPNYYFGISALKDEKEFKVNKVNWIILIVILEMILVLGSGLTWRLLVKGGDSQ